MKPIEKIVLLCLLLWAVPPSLAGDNKQPTAKTPSPTPGTKHNAATGKRECFKGWELYSWQDKSGWRFSLLFGTNRQKSCQEIKSPKASRNFQEIQKEIAQLAPGQWISWQTGMVDCQLSYPPRQVVEAIRTTCRNLDIQEADSLK